MNENLTDEQTGAEAEEAQESTLQPESTETPEQTVETTEKPLGEILQDEQEKESVKQDVDFKELYKKERKDKRQLESRLKKLEESIADDDTSDDDVQSDIDDIADEFNVDKKFLKKLEKSIKANLEADVESKFNSKFKPLEEKEKKDKFVSNVTTYFNNALEKMPEFKGVANLNTILQLATIPTNKDKTVTQLIEETFGSAITGKKTIESSSVRGTVESTEVDFNKAKTDTTYFNEVMANPELKKKYNDGLAKRVLR